MNKEEARVLEANRRLNERSRQRHEAGIACLSCGGDGLKQNGNKWDPCPPCEGTGLNETGRANG